jgi:hypothetical protein
VNDKPATPTTATILAPVPAIGTESPLPRLVSEVFRDSAPPLRARLLEQLLRPVRRLGLAAVAAGAFALFLHPQRWRAWGVSVDDAMRFSGEQVLELARFVEQVQPDALARLVRALAEGGQALPALGGSLLLLAVQLTRSKPAGDGAAPGDGNPGDPASH